MLEAFIAEQRTFATCDYEVSNYKRQFHPHNAYKQFWWGPINRRSAFRCEFHSRVATNRLDCVSEKG